VPGVAGGVHDAHDAGEPGEGGRGLWAAEVEALQQVTAEAGEPVRGGLVFDAFSDDLLGQAVSEVQDARDDGLGSGVQPAGGDESAVDLQFVERQPGEQREAGLAGAEVVEAGADPGGRAARSAGQRPARGG